MASASSPIRFTEVSFVIAAASGGGGGCVCPACAGKRGGQRSRSETAS